jgi:hypothetical protein
MSALGMNIDSVNQRWVNEFQPDLFDPLPSSVIVDSDRPCPYRHLQRCRDIIEDESTGINMTNGFYWCQTGADDDLFSYCRSTIINPLTLDLFNDRLDRLPGKRILDDILTTSI